MEIDDEDIFTFFILTPVQTVIMSYTNGFLPHMTKDYLALGIFRGYQYNKLVGTHVCKDGKKENYSLDEIQLSFQFNSAFGGEPQGIIKTYLHLDFSPNSHLVTALVNMGYVNWAESVIDEINGDIDDKSMCDFLDSVKEQWFWTRFAVIENRDLLMVDPRSITPYHETHSLE